MSVRDVVQAAAGALGGAAGEATYVEDVFSTYLYTGNGSSQDIENGIRLGDSNVGGSAAFDGSGDYVLLDASSDLNLDGDFTVEGWIKLQGVAYHNLIVTNSSDYGNSNWWWLLTDNSSGQILWQCGYPTEPAVNTTNVCDGVWHHFAAVRSSGVCQLFIDGVSGGTNNFSNTMGMTGVDYSIGAWQTSLYSVNGNISNLRIVKGRAVYTSNFTPPTEALGATSGGTNPPQGTETKLLTFQGDTPFVDNSSFARSVTAYNNTIASITGPFTSDVAGEGGLVFIKGRDNTEIPGWYDSERSFARLFSSSTSGQTPGSNWISSANSDGFTLGTDYDVNGPGQTYASWTFRKAPKFFDIVTYTGDGVAGRTVAHNLESVPGVIIVKQTDTSRNWCVYHRSLGNASTLLLQTTDAVYTSQNHWNQTNPTDSVFTVGAEAGTNASGGTYVAYLFAHDAGGFGDSGEENVISCGSYSGTGSSNFIDLGWEPQWVLIKRTTSGGNNWFLFDSMRGIPMGSGDMALYPNATSTEGTRDEIDLNATGFTLTSGLGSTNDSGSTYVYIAIRRGPMKTPETGTEVFTPIAGSSGAPTFKPGHVTDAVIALYRPGDAVYPQMWDRLRGEYYLTTSSTSGEVDDNRSWDYMNGAGNFSGDSNYHGECFRRAPKFFDVVCYTGTGTAQNISHNLTVAPEFIIVKGRDNGVGWWRVYHSSLGEGQVIYLNSTNASGADTTVWNNTAPTSSVFTVGTDTYTNGSGSTYVAYLFASCPGVSKVGSYTGNGTGQNIDCGFSNGARFVLIKGTNGEYSWPWLVFDTARGIVSGNDPAISINSTSAEETGFDFVDPYSAGFSVTGLGNVNYSDVTYIYLAIA